MALPLLRFVAYSEYYTVTVENLTALTVAQIQELEAYARQRRGRLDFATGRMRIAKRIDFDHFNKTLELCGIKADTVASEVINQLETPSNAAVGFGKYKGMCYSELPEEYLLWLKRNYHGREREFIEQELRSRSL